MSFRPISLAVLLLLGACSPIPDNIRQAPLNAPGLAEVQQDAARHKGSKVRWGGTIAKVENRQKETRLEIVARNLDSDGEPVDEDRSLGRFIARVEGFLDPAIYAQERKLTIVGTVEATTTKKLGEMDYTYPVIHTTDLYLWPQRNDADLPPPWYYDPWYYDPWYPYPWRPYRY